MHEAAPGRNTVVTNYYQLYNSNNNNRFPRREAMDDSRTLCPHYHRAVELIGQRWTGAIIFVLLKGPCRFRDRP